MDFLSDPSLLVCGVDEVGRGPWAGPVVAAAVILGISVPGVRDSKKLGKPRREALARILYETASVGLGWASVEEIDRFNILQASFLAMHRAIHSLPLSPDFILIDGKLLPPNLPCPAQALVGGDDLEPSISAASILAKVARDQEMTRLSKHYPEYGWEKNSGYGVRYHADAIKKFGITPIHRQSFRPIRLYIETNQEKNHSTDGTQSA